MNKLFVVHFQILSRRLNCIFGAAILFFANLVPRLLFFMYLVLKLYKFHICSTKIVDSTCSGIETKNKRKAELQEKEIPLSAHSPLASVVAMPPPTNSSFLTSVILSRSYSHFSLRYIPSRCIGMEVSVAATYVICSYIFLLGQAKGETENKICTPIIQLRLCYRLSIFFLFTFPSKRTYSEKFLLQLLSISSPSNK